MPAFVNADSVRQLRVLVERRVRHEDNFDAYQRGYDKQHAKLVAAREREQKLADRMTTSLVEAHKARKLARLVLDRLDSDTGFPSDAIPPRRQELPSLAKGLKAKLDDLEDRLLEIQTEVGDLAKNKDVDPDVRVDLSKAYNAIMVASNLLLDVRGDEGL